MTRTRSTKITALAAALILATLTLTGCTASRAGSDPEHALRSEWVATSQGDVNCLTSYSKGGYTTYDCNWNTLTNPGTHTTEDSRHVDGTWTHTDQGEVFCLISYTKGGYRSYTCNWNELQ